MSLLFAQIKHFYVNENGVLVPDKPDKNKEARPYLEIDSKIVKKHGWSFIPDAEVAFDSNETTLRLNITIFKGEWPRFSFLGDINHRKAICLDNLVSHFNLEQLTNKERKIPIYVTEDSKFLVAPLNNPHPECVVKNYLETHKNTFLGYHKSFTELWGDMQEFLGGFSYFTDIKNKVIEKSEITLPSPKDGPAEEDLELIIEMCNYVYRKGIETSLDFA